MAAMATTFHVREWKNLAILNLHLSNVSSIPQNVLELRISRHLTFQEFLDGGYHGF